MKIQLYMSGQLHPLTIDSCRTIKDIKVAVSRRYMIPVSDQKLFFNQRELDNDELIENAHIGNDDIVELHSISQDKLHDTMALLFNTPVERIPELYEQNQEFHEFINTMGPDISKLMSSSSRKELLKVLLEMAMNMYFREISYEDDKTMDEEEEMDPEAQQRAMERIHQQNIAMTQAVPIGHRSAHLYVKTHINDVLVNFVVDTGAQFTSVSNRVAEATFLKRGINEKVQTEVRGVGSSTTDGLLNAFDVCIEGQYFAASSLVLPLNNGADVCLLGLDFLKSYKAIIDVDRDVLSLMIDDKRIETQLYERRYADPLKEISEQEEDDDNVMDEVTQENDESESNEGLPSLNADLIATTAQRLQEMGFSVEDSQAASIQANGDIDLALEILNGRL